MIARFVLISHCEELPTIILELTAGISQFILQAINIVVDIFRFPEVVFDISIFEVGFQVC